MEKIRWFKQECIENKVYDDQEVRLLIEKYLNQAATEIAEINATGKSFWKLTSKQASYEKEKKAFVEGSFFVPDLTSKKNMAKLLSWDGVNTKYIEHIKMKKYKQVPDVKDRDKEIVKIPHEEIKKHI